MAPAFLVFLSSGLFLGWSLGANDAANVFGTAVGSRMLRFSTAAAICAVFVVLGAVISGAGPSHGLGQLGAVNALGGSFTVALAAALTVYGMTKFGLPVSTTQAVVGGTSLYGGRGTIIGTVVGVVLLRSIRNGIIIIGVPGLAYNMFVGLVILVAVILQALAERRRPGSI